MAHRADRFTAIAKSRLAESAEGELPEIQAWRRAFSRMGLKPTQYRCAAESLLRRFRKEGALPALHPLVDLCNAVSLAFAIPVAVFDVSGIDGFLEVRYAAGDEDYLTFSGEVEHPGVHEVIFADRAGQAHARRWSNRQSGKSAVRDSTTAALIVAEAMHDSASSDVPALTAALAEELDAVWSAAPAPVVLTPAASRFTFGAEPSRGGGGDRRPGRSAFDVGQLLGHLAVFDGDDVNAADVTAVPVVAPALHHVVTGADRLLDREVAAAVIEDRLPGGTECRLADVTLTVGRGRGGLEHAVLAAQRQSGVQVVVVPGRVEAVNDRGHRFGTELAGHVHP